MNDLYAAVIHDVKNQLAELALRLGKRGDAAEEMEAAMNASMRLSKMLMLHREANDQLWVTPDSVNPADLLAILAAEYRELFPSISILVDVERSPACAFFDVSLVRLALGNALHNACRHAHASVRISAFEQGGMLVFAVSDDGPGFPETILERKGKSPSESSGTGTGLGLYLAGRIAELHRLQDRHGYIELDNSHGALFRMVLP